MSIARRGRIALGFLVLAIGFLGGLAWYVSRGDEAQHDPIQAERTNTEAARASAGPVATAPERQSLSGTVAGDYDKDFDGRGKVRGIVDTPSGVEFPARWDLVIGPSKHLEGSERAETREISFTAGEREFEVDRLPLGGYAFRARAPGMNGTPQDVLLFAVAGRPDLPGNREAYLRLSLYPAGYLEGSLISESGRLVESLTVTLVPEDADQAIRETETDNSGFYRFEGVLDGNYTLVFGDVERPLIAREKLFFRAPSMRFPERTVPDTGTVRFVILDELGLPIPDAAIRGFAKKGGNLDLVSDAKGEALARFLEPGSYRAIVQHRTGRRGRADFVLEDLSREKLVEVMCPKK